MHFVISILQIASDDQGSKGYGFVHFETQEVARSAIEKVHGMMLNLKKCTSSHLNLMIVVMRLCADFSNVLNCSFVECFMSRKVRLDAMSNRTRGFTNIYIKNFGNDTEEEKLLDLLETLSAVR